MKTCFSTLGCPEWQWEDIIACCKDFGYDGIEIRGIENELFIPKIKQFTIKEADKTKEKLNKMGIQIACLDSACYLHLTKNDPKYIEEAKKYIDTANVFNVPFVRVLGDTDPSPSDNIDISSVIFALNELSEYSKGKNVTILIETNGVFANSTLLKQCLMEIKAKNIGVLWDIHHPFRFFNETPEKTYDNLKNYIKHIHIKDSILVNNKIKYKMIGEGDVPIYECLSLLKKDSYSGFVSLEWVKRWYDDLEEPGIVFMHFINTIKSIWGSI